MLVLDVGAPDGPLPAQALLALHHLDGQLHVCWPRSEHPGPASFQSNLLDYQLNPQKIRPKISRFQHAGLESH